MHAIRLVNAMYIYHCMDHYKRIQDDYKHGIPVVVIGNLYILEISIEVEYSLQ